MKKIFLCGLLALAWLSPSKGRAVDYFLTVSATTITQNAPTTATLMLGQDAGTGALRALQVDKNGNFSPSGGGGVSGTAVTTYFAMNAVTYASSVAGTSMQYLTLSSRSSLFIDNVTAGSVYFVLSNSSTAPTNTSTIRLSVPTARKSSPNSTR